MTITWRGMEMFRLKTKLHKTFREYFYLDFSFLFDSIVDYCVIRVHIDFIL